MLVSVHTKFKFLAPDSIISEFEVGVHEVDTFIALHPFNQEYLVILEEAKEAKEEAKEVKTKVLKESK